MAGGVRRFARRERSVLVLFICGIVLIGLGLAITAPLTSGEVRITRVSFSNANSPAKEKIAGLLYSPPDPQPPGKLPACVFSHGLTANKEIYLPFCRELARQGFVVLAVDLPGHGGSGGHCDLGSTEYTALLSAADWLVANHHEVDPAKVAAVGHSLGGISATRAGILQQPKRFSAVAAIFCWQGFRQATELVYGPVADNLARIWPFVLWSRDFDVNDRRAMARRDIISAVGPTAPPNYLLVVGEYDEGCTVQQNRQLVARAVGTSDIEPGKQYGSFEDGTARQLTLTADTHVTEVFSTSVFNGVYRWLCDSFGIKAAYLQPELFFRYTGWGFIYFGALLAGVSVSLGLFRELEPELAAVGGRAPLEDALAPESRTAGLAAVSYFLLISLAALPLAKLLGIKVVVPFFAGDIASSILIVRGLLALLGIAGAVLLLARSTGAFHELDWRRGARRDLLSMLAAAAGFVAFLFLYTPLARALYLGPGLPYSWLWFLLFAAIVTLALWVEGRYFHLLLLPLYALDTTKSKATYLASEAATRSVAQALILLPVLSGPLHVVGRAGSLRAPVVLLALFGSFPAYLVLAWLNLKAREKGGSLLAPSLFAGLFLAWFLTTIICVR
jgi:pimeloyl-ACP methyl ester carboxylesterase